MTEIYLEIAKLTDKFRTMAYGLTTDENKVNEAVQELMLYFMQMNPDILKGIYEKDGILGITRYGAVALRRALTSTRSNFYYKYHETNTWEYFEKIDKELDKLDYWYDRELFKLYYYEGNTLDSLTKKTRISRNSIFSTIDKVRNILKKNLNE